MRLLFDLFVHGPPQERAAILGGGEAGELAILICQRCGVNARPVVVLESDPAKNNFTVRGVPVRSVAKGPIKVLNAVNATSLIIPFNAELSAADHEIVDECEQAGVRVVRLHLAMIPKDHDRSSTGLSALLNSVSEPAYEVANHRDRIGASSPISAVGGFPITSPIAHPD
jgi:FlaA1/EpsC-like NDP-sugar epimerase